jgi:hypothetical protein
VAKTRKRELYGQTDAEDIGRALPLPNGPLIYGMPRLTEPRVVPNARRPASQIGHGNNSGFPC